MDFFKVERKIEPRGLKRRKAIRECLRRENSIKTFKKRIIEGCKKKIGVRERRRIEGRPRERIYEGIFIKF